MKKLTLFLLAVMFISLSHAAFSKTSPKEYKDTIIVNFGSKGKMVIFLDNVKDLNTLKSYNLDDIISKLELYFDSAAEGSNDTSFVMKAIMEKDGKRTEETVKFKIENPKKGVDEETVTISLGQYKLDIFVTDSSTNGKNKKHVTFNTRREYKPRRTATKWNIYLGLNNYLHNGNFPDAEGALYALNPLRSRYVSLSMLEKTRIGREKSPAYIKYGLELSFNNFMFQEDTRLEKLPNGINFYHESNNLVKSKVVNTFLNAPVVPMLDFGHKGFRIGFGGYVGYRLLSYSKIKFEDNKKVKDRSNFYLNNFRYGLRAELGFRSINLFANYDLTGLFSKDKAPNLNVFSFGIIL